MEDSWLLSILLTPISLNTNTLTFETKEMKIQRELFILIDQTTSSLEYFGKNLEQQKEVSYNRISQMEV